MRRISASVLVGLCAPASPCFAQSDTSAAVGTAPLEFGLLFFVFAGVLVITLRLRRRRLDRQAQEKP